MSTTSFTAAQTADDGETTGTNQITLNAAPADWFLTYLAASAVDTDAHLFVTVDGVLSFTTRIKSSGPPFQTVIGGGDPNREELAGIPVPHGKVAVVELEPIFDTPPPGWTLDLTIGGVVRGYVDAQFDAVTSSVTFNTQNSPLPGQPPRRGSVFGG